MYIFFLSVFIMQTTYAVSQNKIIMLRIINGIPYLIVRGNVSASFPTSILVILLKNFT